MAKQKCELTHKEIYEQASAFEGVNNNLDNIYKTLDEVFNDVKPEEIIFTGCGTSLYLAQTLAASFSYYNTIPSKAVPCSELYFFPETYIKEHKVLVVPITRRSDTTEVKMAINKVREYKNVTTLAITCDERSKEYNDYYILSPEAKEKSVIMTKSFSSMVYLGVIMSLYAAGKKDLLEQSKNIVSVCEKMINQFDSTAKQIVDENENLNLYITLGQGAFYGIANECMNKIKEMAIANSEAYYTLEYRHGPMALVDNNTIVMLLASENAGDLEGKLIAQMKDIGAKTFVIGDCLSDNMKKYADYYMELACGFNDIQRTPLVGIIGQLIGYYAAEKKGLDVDSPRNLTQAIIL